MSKKHKTEKAVEKEVQNEVKEPIDGICTVVDEDSKEVQKDEKPEPEKEGIVTWVTVKEKRKKALSYVFTFSLGAAACLGCVWGFGKYLEGKDIADAIDPAAKVIPDLVSEAVSEDLTATAIDVASDAVVENL